MERKVFYKNEIRILALVVFVMSMVFTFKSYAAEITDTWENGNTIVTYDSDGVLTVTAKPGTDGRMKYNGHYPWEGIRNNITHIEVKEGITFISAYAFEGILNSDGITGNIAESVIEIEQYAFRNTFIKEVNIFGNTKIGKDVFYLKYSECGNSYGPRGVINVYKDLQESGKFIQAYGSSTLSRPMILNYKEGVRDVYLTGVSVIKIPSTAKRIFDFSKNSYAKPQLSLEEDVSLEYIGDEAFKLSKFLSENKGKFLISNITYIGNSGLDGLDISGDLILDNLTYAGVNAFNGYNGNIIINSVLENISANCFSGVKGVVSLDLSNTKSIGNLAFDKTTLDIEELKFDNAGISIGNSVFNTNTSLKSITVGEGAYTSVSFNGITNLEKFVILPNNKTKLFNLSSLANLKELYWFGEIGSTMTKTNIPSTAQVYCLKDSPVETWCKNNSVSYTALTDEEVGEIINGKLPTLEKDSFMFDGDASKDLSFTVNLGEKPAGATGIKKVLVDNEMIPIDSWEFNGTDKVTIFSEYLEILTNGTHTVSVLFNNDTFRSGATITVINSQQGNGSDEPPEALITITYEFYKDYPDYVIIPVKLNGASAITRLRLGSTEVVEADYKLEDGAIILDKDLLLTMDVGKYRVLPTFNDKDKTTLTNIQLVVYENAADRAAPYLLQSRLVFDNSPIVLKFAPGAGDLTATNVLALILDDDVILPTGELVPFTKKNVLRVQAAYKEALEIDQPYVREDVEEEEIVATPSDATKRDDADYVEDDMQVEVGTPSEATKPAEDEIIDEDFLVDEDIDDGFLIDEEEDDKDNVASPSEASFVAMSLPTRSQRANRFSLLTVSESKKDKDEDKEDELSELAMVMAELEYGTNNVFYVDGDEIILDADYIESLNLSEGDHLIGAIFDNTERTTDVKKVILIIPSSGDSGDDNKPENPDDNKPVNPDDNKPENPDDNKPSNPDGDRPVNPPVDEDDNNSSGGGNGGSSGGGGGSHSGGGSTGGNSKPDNGNGPGNGSILKPDGSINPDYTTDVPDNGGRWEGSGNDWTYILPDGSVPKGEWVGDGENWFYVNKDGKLEYDWFCDPVTNKWYMLNRENNGKFGAALKGWYFEVQDGKYYFLNPGDFSMFTGWAFINSEWYFFSPTPEGITYIGDNQSGWKFDTNTTLRPYGSMFINETTPDGYKVDNTGKYVK